jgi:transaldolase
MFGLLFFCPFSSVAPSLGRAICFNAVQMRRATALLMNLFIDSVSLEEVSDASELGLLDGVLVRPAALADARVGGLDATMRHYRTLAELTDAPVLVPAPSAATTDAEGLIHDGELLTDLHPNVVISLPLTRAGMRALSFFGEKGIKSCATGITTVAQAVLAARVGAAFVQIPVDRLENEGQEWLRLLEQLVTVYDNYSFGTLLVASGLRTPLQLALCAEQGVDVVACHASLLYDQLG